MQTIDLSRLVHDIGRNHLAAYGISVLGTVFAVAGKGRGTVLHVTPREDLSSLMAACPPDAYPRRLVALLAEIVEALEVQGYDARPLPSELFALASELLLHKHDSPCDLLERARQLDSTTGPYVVVPRNPAAAPRKVEIAADSGPLVRGGLGEMESQIAAVPADQWSADLNSRFAWFNPETYGDFFAFMVARQLSHDGYDGRDISEARASLFGWPPILTAGTMLSDKQIRSLLCRAPTAQRAIP